MHLYHLLISRRKVVGWLNVDNDPHLRVLPDLQHCVGCHPHSGNARHANERPSWIRAFNADAFGGAARGVVVTIPIADFLVAVRATPAEGVPGNTDADNREHERDQHPDPNSDDPLGLGIAPDHLKDRYQYRPVQ